MNYFRWIINIVYSLVYLYYQITGVAERKVLIKSVKSSIRFHDLEIPVREFTALSKRNKPMGSSKVMIGRFEEEEFQYCVMYDLFIPPLYRRRKLAQKLIKSGMKFCGDEKFGHVIAIIKKSNGVSMSLFQKLGFELLQEDQWTNWMRKEVELYKVPAVVALYEIKKPAQVEPV